jgi:hypothetical protein
MQGEQTEHKRAASSLRIAQSDHETPKMRNGTERDLMEGNPKFIFACNYIHTPYLMEGNPKRLL